MLGSNLVRTADGDACDFVLLKSGGPIAFEGPEHITDGSGTLTEGARGSEGSSTGIVSCAGGIGPGRAGGV